MMKKLMIAALLLTGFAAPASAMDDAERARQMNVYKAYQQTGQGIVTTTTTVTTQETATPAAPVAARAPEILPVAAPNRKIAKGQMSPLNDDGTPMNVKPDADTMGVTPARQAQEMEAYEAYKAGRLAQSGVTTTTVETTVTAPQVIQPGIVQAPTVQTPAPLVTPTLAMPEAPATAPATAPMAPAVAPFIPNAVAPNAMGNAPAAILAPAPNTAVPNTVEPAAAADSIINAPAAANAALEVQGARISDGDYIDTISTAGNAAQIQQPAPAATRAPKSLNN